LKKERRIETFASEDEARKTFAKADSGFQTIELEENRKDEKKKSQLEI
jgi:hypothetical protein